MAAARLHSSGRSSGRATLIAMLLWSALSMLPDAHVIGVALGVRHEDPWGHRGATHSLVVALAVGLIIGLAACRGRSSALRTGVLATVVVASAILDTDRQAAWATPQRMGCSSRRGDPPLRAALLVRPEKAVDVGQPEPVVRNRLGAPSGVSLLRDRPGRLPAGSHGGQARSRGRARGPVPRSQQRLLSRRAVCFADRRLEPIVRRWVR